MESWVGIGTVISPMTPASMVEPSNVTYTLRNMLSVLSMLSLACACDGHETHFSVGIYARSWLAVGPRPLESSGIPRREIHIRKTIIDASRIEKNTWQRSWFQVAELRSACSENPRHFIHSRIITRSLHYIWRRCYSRTSGRGSHAHWARSGFDSPE